MPIHWLDVLLRMNSPGLFLSFPFLCGLGSEITVVDWDRLVGYPENGLGGNQ